MISQSAIAMWTVFDEGEGGKAYFDPDRVEKYDYRYQSIWLLFDSDTVQEDPIKQKYKSVVMRQLVDCSKRQNATIAVFYHSGNLGSGKVVFDKEFPPADFKSSPPNSLGDKIANLACKK